MAESQNSGAQNKAKGRQHRKKANYYKEQFQVTLNNKRRRAAKRTKKRSANAVAKLMEIARL